MRKIATSICKRSLLILFALTLSLLSFSQYNIFNSSHNPSTTVFRDYDGTVGIEVGVKFTSAHNGVVNAIRFYKAVGMTGTHIGHLWSEGGTLLGTATFSSETASGWQEAPLSSPVNITANTVYIASCLSSSGHYIVNNTFTSAVINGPLTALRDISADEAAVSEEDEIEQVDNGVFSFYNSASFPDSNYLASNYWIDVNVDIPDATAPTSPTICYAGRTSTSISLLIAGSTDNVAVTDYNIYNGNTLLATLPYNSNAQFKYVVTGLPAETNYSDIKVKAKDLKDNESTASASFSKTTLASNMFFDEGFEGSCPWEPFAEIQDNLGGSNTWARQQSTTIANEGTSSYRAEVRNGCDGCKFSGYRSELLPGIPDTDKRWYGFSVYFNAPDSSGIWNGIEGHFLQWHPTPGGGSAVLGLWGAGGAEGWNLVTVTNGGSPDDNITNQPITTNTWHHVVLYVDWDAEDGSVMGWIDGVKKWDLTGLEWGEDGQYMKLGMNRWGSGTCSPATTCSGTSSPTTGTWVIYYDNLRIGDDEAGYGGVAPDAIPPSSFTLSTTGQTTSTIGLSWTEATDASEMVSYDIYKDGVYVATTTSLTYELTGLSACTEYTIYVKAKDPLGNFTNSNTIKVATKCAPACVTILSYDAVNGDDEAVHELTNVPSGALLVVSCQTETNNSDAIVSSLPELTWTKRADAEATGSGDAEIWTAVYTDGGDISVKADFGNFKHSSVCYVIRNQEATLGGASETDVSQTQPSVEITTTRANSIIIGGISDWNADESDPRIYETPVTETHYRHVNLGYTSYNFYKPTTTAGAYTAGVTDPDNQSAGTTLYEIRCPAAETTAPTAPVLCVTGKTQTTLTIAEGTAATDNEGVTGYIIYVTGKSPVTTLSLPYTITSLTAGTEYGIYVRVRDASGNISAPSATIQGLTLATNILFDEGFEGCAPWANWTTDQDAGHAWSRQQSDIEVSEGIHSFRAEVGSGCDGYASSGFRSEVVPKNITDAGVMWYGVSIYLDEPYSAGNWTGSYNGTILQWNPDGTPGSSVLSLLGSEGEWNLVTNHSGYYDTREHSSGVDITRGWHHIVFKVNWGSGGYVKVWIDGNLLFDLADGVNSTWFSPENLDWETGRYLKVGMSRWGNCSSTACTSGSDGPCDTWILYYDNVRIGNSSATYEDVAPLALTEMERRPVQPKELVIEAEKKYFLGQNFPNPVTGHTTIPFALPKTEKVNLILYDQNGKVVKVLASKSFVQGMHTISFNKASLSAGIYYYEIKAGNFSSVKKLIIQ